MATLNSSLIIPEGTQTVLPQFKSAELDAIRLELYRLNDHFGLWEGIAACLPDGVTFKGYSDEQVIWEYHIIWGSATKGIWVASRGFSKTWTSIDAYIKKMLLRKTWVVWIPGGSIEQTEQARAYFQAYFDSNPNLDTQRGEKWTETYKTLRNGSFIKFTSATPRGVQSKRATDVHSDEGQLLEPSIYQLAKRQATRKAAKFNLTGTALADTLFHYTFEDPSTPFRMMTPVHLAVAAGIIDEQKVIDDMNDPQILLADNLEQLWCIWQRKSDRAFRPKIVTTIPTNYVPNSDAWGIDFNPSAGHWATRSLLLTDGRVITVEERRCESFEELLDLPPGRLFPEDGGTNTGYVDALVFLNKDRKKPRYIHRPSEKKDKATHREGNQNINDHFWTEKTKSRQVATLLLLQEKEGWLILDSVANLKKAAPIMPFNNKGMPDKDKAEELNINAHVVDSDIHSVCGALTPSYLDMVGELYGIA